MTTVSATVAAAALIQAKSYTLGDVSRATGISRRTLGIHAHRGQIKAWRLGSRSRWRIPEAEFLRLLVQSGLQAPMASE